MSDSINEQRHPHCCTTDHDGATGPHYVTRGRYEGDETFLCPGPPVVTPPAQDEPKAHRCGECRSAWVCDPTRTCLGRDAFVDDLESTDYDGLCQEISDGFTGETGDLVRDHARAVLTIRSLRAAPSVSTDPEKVRAQALHEAILAVHNSRFYKGEPDCNYNGVRNAERVLREQLGAQLNYPAHTCESADTGHTPKKERTMRDIIAALLRSRGYTHGDEADPYDMHWQHDALGVRPILACVAQEMNGDLGRPTPGWDTYEVSVAR